MGLISQLIYGILYAFELVLLARALLTWFPNIDRSNPLIRLLFDITEPILKPIRDLLPPNTGFDFSPVVAFIIIQVLLTILPAILR